VVEAEPEEEEVEVRCCGVLTICTWEQPQKMGDLILNEMHRNAIFVFFLMPGRSRIIFL
jgi:hypothetical protein